MKRGRTPSNMTAEAAKPLAVEKASKTKLNVSNFYAFLQCQLKMEAEVHMDLNVELKDPAAKAIWTQYEKLSRRNQGANEKWVPYHTVLGIHEKFIVENIHHAKGSWWNPENRFIAMLLFRVTCKGDLWHEVIAPVIQKPAFWKNPGSYFQDGSPMEKAMLAYRKRGLPLQTSCFLMIPERLVADDDLNLVRNILRRSKKIIDLSKDLWPIVNSSKSLSSDERFDKISSLVSAVPGFGETWVKMLMVCVDLGYPKLKLLQDRCEVGVGAVGGLEQILIGEGLLEPRPEKQPMGPRREKDGTGDADSAVVVRNLMAGIICVKQQGKQIIQVVKGMAGNLDKAEHICLQLAELHNKGKGIDTLNAKKQEMLADGSLKYPALGLDEQAEELKSKKQEAFENGLVPERGAKKAWLMEASSGLVKLQGLINDAKSPSSEHFWTLLATVETHARKHFKGLDLILQQMKTPKKKMSAAIVQVQLCEWRQFQAFMGRSNGVAILPENGEAGRGPKRARTS